MKKTSWLVALIMVVVVMLVRADSKVEAGPKGGRLLAGEFPRAEFFVEKDRTISLTFYDQALKTVAVADQTASATAETKSGKVKLDFEKKEGQLVSKTALPEGDGYTLVLQLRTNPEAKPKNFRIPLELHVCGGCSRAEYACTCHE